MIVKPAVGISTAAAYAALDARPGRVPGQATTAWLMGSHALHNDFSPVAASVPEIAAVFRALPDAPLMLCGSGSALFCRLQDQSQGAEWAARVSEQGLGKVWLTRTIGHDA
jgi:4-diphosphocytidyl-2C-methyl-D-erythritol kinase